MKFPKGAKEAYTAPLLIGFIPDLENFLKILIFEKPG